MRKKKRRILLAVSLIIGILYVIYSINYWSGVNTGSFSDAEEIGAGIAAMLVMPSLVMTSLAVIFNALGLFMYGRPFTLVAAILYTVALVLFPVYFMFVITEMVFCYIAFARMNRKPEADNNIIHDEKEPVRKT